MDTMVWNKNRKMRILNAFNWLFMIVLVIVSNYVAVVYWLAYLTQKKQKMFFVEEAINPGYNWYVMILPPVMLIVVVLAIGVSVGEGVRKRKYYLDDMVWLCYRDGRKVKAKVTEVYPDGNGYAFLLEDDTRVTYGSTGKDLRAMGVKIRRRR